MLFKPALKILLICILILALTALAYLFKRIGKLAWRDMTMSLCSGWVLWVVGVKVEVVGKPSTQRPLLVVANHLSYLDVPILNSRHPLLFTPKIDMKSWPFFGWMCKVQGSIFVDRHPEKIKEVSANIEAALAGDGAVCLFPEATTGNGLHLLPFKSSFFSLAEEKIGGRELVVQPVSIAYMRIRNLPIDMTQWPEIAWYGDMALAPHLWNLLKIAPISAKLTYLAPVTLRDLGDRKKLAAHCQKVISEELK
ncbi:MAG: 1-acyl-sn-glycerol-3-phosphate acyltransferase [Alphaproteobacteria bacterium]|nr:1-acyl-sn-glycerol-3-phosphate acyltransferase [Alphaproteobacteria bacterium]